MGEIEFICSNEYKDAIPYPHLASKNKPKWFQELRDSDEGRCPIMFYNKIRKPDDMVMDRAAHLGGCPAVGDMLEYGYYIPAWTNFFFHENEDGFTYHSESNTICDYHKADDQFWSMPEELSPRHDAFVKIVTPWIIRTSPGVSCIITHPYWTRENRFTTSYGIVHSDLAPTRMKWFFEWNQKLDPVDYDKPLARKDYSKHYIETGTPLIQIIPFHRKKVEHKITTLSSSDYEDLDKQQMNRLLLGWFSKSNYGGLRGKIGRLFR